MIGKIDTKNPKPIRKVTQNGKSDVYKNIDGNKEWDKIWENPKSYIVLEELVQEAIDQIKQGEFTEGGFGDI